MNHEVGTVERGKAADFVAFRGDPPDDIEVTGEAAMTVRRGKIVSSHRR